MYVLPALLVHRRALLDPARAGGIWLKVARGAARSSLFLALYCTLAWRGAARTLVGSPIRPLAARVCNFTFHSTPRFWNFEIS